jgi:hypothetical protein
MKVKILHPVYGSSYFGGEILNLNDEVASNLVAKGHAIMIPETEPELKPITPIKAYVREEETIKKTPLTRKRIK